MVTPMDQDTKRSKSGLVLHSAARYDLLVRVATLGRERAFRENILRLAQLRPGQTVLDIGCGTGSLAIAAKRLVGAGGKVHGIDASPEMIARARRKAKAVGVEVEFTESFAQKLPFADAQFDKVLSTLMLHHLPRQARAECAREMRRVMKPGGSVLAVDFAKPTNPRGFLARFHRHGHIPAAELGAVLREAGLREVESGAVGFRNLRYVLAGG